MRHRHETMFVSCHLPEEIIDQGLTSTGSQLNITVTKQCTLSESLQHGDLPSSFELQRNKIIFSVPLSKPLTK